MLFNISQTKIFHPLCPLLNSLASYLIHGWHSCHVLGCQDPSNFTASSAYPFAPVRSPLKYNTWRVSCSENQGHFFSGGVLLITTGLSGSMFVCSTCVRKKHIKHWKSLQIPVLGTSISSYSKFQNLACPDPQTEFSKTPPPTDARPEPAQMPTVQWSSHHCSPALEKPIRRSDQSAECRVEPVQTASLVSTTSAGVEDVLRQCNSGQQLLSEIWSNTFRPIPSKCSMACATE